MKTHNRFLRDLERERLTLEVKAALRDQLRQRSMYMTLLMISTALASLAMGVTIAYVLCSALFAAFRMHVRAHVGAPLRIHPKTMGS